jgi:predicted alpha/beta superfamily hydrolase
MYSKSEAVNCPWKPEVMKQTPAAEIQTPQPVESGHVAVHDTDSVQHHHNFVSQHVPHTRDLAVYLPPRYGDSDRRFPVLYLHDGQNLFDPDTSYVRGMDWKVDETADALIRTGAIAPLIIVAVFNTGEHRIEEYTPTRDRKLGGGHAELYGRMLVEELKPFIDGRYRTLDGPSNTGLGGSSLGGLATLYLGFTYPQIFGKLAVLSPSVWWDNKAILKIIGRSQPKPRLKIWLSMGTEESKNGLRDAESLRDALVRKGWREGDDLHYEVILGGKHEEAAWAESVDPVLRYLFSPGS